MLDEIDVDVSGCCQSAIYPDISDKLLECEKEKSRKALHGEDWE